MKLLLRGVTGGQSREQDKKKQERKGKKRNSKGGGDREKQRVPVFRIYTERKQCDLRALFSMVHAITSHRRGIIKRTGSG